jgi:K+-sensing histidine kinase KdpD
MPGPRPLAVGLIHHSPSSDEISRRKTRVSLMARADAEGFAVAEVFETDGQPVKDDAALSALESLARRIGARTVLTIGAIDRTFLTIVARRSQLMVLTMPDRSTRRSRRP